MQKYIQSPRVIGICFRIADGLIGMNHLNCERVEGKFIIDGNRIQNENGSMKGVYNIDTQLITWRFEQQNESFVWARSGKLMSNKAITYPEFS